MTKKSYIINLLQIEMPLQKCKKSKAQWAIQAHWKYEHVVIFLQKICDVYVLRHFQSEMLSEYR